MKPGGGLKAGQQQSQMFPATVFPIDQRSLQVEQRAAHVRQAVADVRFRNLADSAEITKYLI